LDMPEDFKALGKEFLISRNLAFMSQHMNEVWIDHENFLKKIRKVRDEQLRSVHEPLEVVG